MKKLCRCLLLVMVVSVIFISDIVMVSAEDQIELRMTWWGSQKRHDLTIQVIELFQKMHPNIKIVYEFSGWRDYWTKLTTQAAGGNLPDIMQHDYARISEWVSRGLLLPLDGHVQSGAPEFLRCRGCGVSGGQN